MEVFLEIGAVVDAFVVDGVVVGREELEREISLDQWQMSLCVRWSNDKKGNKWTSEVPIDFFDLS